MRSFSVNPKQIDQIKQKLIELGLKEKTNPHGADYIHPEYGQIRVYNKGTILPQGKNEDYLMELWRENFDWVEENNETEKKENMVFSYPLPHHEAENLKNELTEFAASQQYNYESRDIANAYYSLIINDPNTQNKVTITQYVRRLTLQGLNTELWEEITDLVGTVLNLSLHTTYAQVVARPGSSVEIVSVITSDSANLAEGTIKKRLGSCYDYLWQHDKDYVVASQCLIDSGIGLPDYFPCVAGTIKAIEGFTKKLLIDIGAFTAAEIATRTGSDPWTFQKVLDKGIVTSRVMTQLSSDLSRKQNQLKALRTLVQKGITHRRHPHLHDGAPGTVKVLGCMDDACSLHEEILSIILTSYQAFEKELP